MELKFIYFCATAIAYRYFVDTLRLRDMTLILNAVIEGHIFLYLPGISLDDCLENCKTRVSCKSVNYKRQFHLCELNSVNEDTVSSTKTPGSVVYSKKQSIDDVLCGSTKCSDTQACNTHTGKCEVKECKPLHETEKTFNKGNLASVGNKVVTGCKDGFSPKTGSDALVTSECRSNGTWGPTIECVRACNNRAHATDRTKFMVNANGVWKEMSCSSNTAYNPTTCQCSDYI